MAIKTISQFDAATPTSNDKILFEQNGEGKSTTIGNAVNTCSLTFEEIQAGTDLTNKIPKASAIVSIDNKFLKGYSGYINPGETMKFQRGAFGCFLLCGYANSGIQYSFYFISPTETTLISGERAVPTITIDSASYYITLSNTIGWAVYFTLIGPVTRIS